MICQHFFGQNQRDNAARFLASKARKKANFQAFIRLFSGKKPNIIRRKI